MYRCITELKALVIDVDSFENINLKLPTPVRCVEP